MVSLMDKETFISHLNRKILDKTSINLAVGQPDFKPPQHIIKAFKDNIEVNTGYTPIQGIPVLRQEIQKKLRRENNINAEEIIVTTGAIESIFDIMLTYLKPKDEIMLFTPSYNKYRSIAEILGSTIKNISLKNNRPDIFNLKQSITKKTKMIIINSPNNPTGIVFSSEEIKHIVDLAEKNNIICISDEVYEKYVYDQAQHISPASISNTVITVNSFSKSFGFPGLRMGYLAGSSDLINPILKTHMSNTTCSLFAAQMAAVTALQLKTPIFNIEVFDMRRKYVINKLNEMGLSYIYPEGAFYVYIYIDKNSLDFAYLLLKNNVLCMPSQLYGDHQNALRISYAVDIDLLKKGLTILGNVL